jgi:hypothetical protein
MNIFRHSVSLAVGFFLFLTLFLLSGCGKDSEPSQSDATSPKATVDRPSQSQDEFDEKAYQKAKDEAMAASEKAYEARANGAPLPPSLFRFPNTPEPEQSIPNYLNFYAINDHYPTYLLCEYRVDKREYSQSDEPGWFKASLKQIRQSGPKEFPPLQWIAVIIVNSADWESGSTFEQAYKVGAIFKASDVFNPSCDLSQLVAHTGIDRQPFKYDPSQVAPRDQQRWLIVEQHAATNSASGAPK